MSKWTDGANTAESSVAEPDLGTASADEIFDFLDNELEASLSY